VAHAALPDIVIARNSIVKVGVLALCALGAKDLLMQLVALNPFFAGTAFAAGLPWNLSLSISIDLGGPRFNFPLTIVIWFGSAYALHKNSARFAPSIGGLAFAALMTHLVLLGLLLRGSSFGAVSGILWATVSMADFCYVAVVVSVFMLGLKRFEATGDASGNMRSTGSTDPPP